MLEEFYACTTIPFAFLMGRPLLENAKLVRSGYFAQGEQRVAHTTSPFMPPRTKRAPSQSVKAPVWAISCTTGTLFSSRSDALKIRTPAVGSDIGDEEEVHPSVYQVITIDGQSQDIIMMNDSPYPVLVSAGALVVARACLVEDGQKPSSAEQAFDPKGAAADPFGVRSSTSREVLAAIINVIACRLADRLVDKVLQHTEDETRQVQDIRKRFVFYLSSDHVQAERVNLVLQAQQNLAGGSDPCAMWPQPLLRACS